ncbi:response regulator transcription factor [Cohnella sp. REN36]|uniref:response regulator transcription factor n=1 Tax=Cohnella sp. REN36 TaxID=2887347 RepID=UPI001D137E37|nr:response regulator transcription factor [Cohnella sp. REN36]MCC3374333.1 response regulator transcription factor [Cohnella sp. REN36]
MKVVWIEDERQLLREWTQYLKKESIEVFGAETVAEAKVLVEEKKPDMLLVDWMLPGGESGLELCKWNERHWGLPFMMVTAKGDELDKVLALELGADDYLTKPFGLRELSARIKAVLRRTGKGKPQDKERQDEQVVEQGQLRLDFVRFTAQLEQKRLELTRTEFLLLWTLASNPGRVFTRTHLMDEALGDVFIGYERTLDSHIRNLRRKLEEGGAHCEYIQTVYGVGYRFADQADER